MKKFMIALFLLFGLFVNNVARGQVTFNGFVNYPIEGTFADHLATGDFNNDGKTDVAVATSSYSNQANDFKLFVYLQNSNNQLFLSDVYPYSQTYGVNTITSGDINNDGLTDVVIGFGNEIGIYYQNASGKLNLPVSVYAGNTVDALKIGDVNGDGLNDIAISLWNQPDIAVMYSDSINRLSCPYYYPSAISGYSDIEIAKLGTDNFNSVIKMHGQGYIPYVSAYHIKRDRKIETLTNLHIIPNQNNMYSIAVGNICGDNRNELVYSFRDVIGVWGASPDNTFSVRTPYNPGALTVGDLNNDGYDDIVMLSSSRIHVVINGVVYIFPANAPNGNAPDAVAVADVNSDGKMDIVYVNSYRGLSVMINTTGNVVTESILIEESPLKIFPNPCVDVLNINNTKEGEILTIYDSTSRVVKKLECNSNKTIIRTETLTSGIYFINISGETFKFIKK